MRAFLSRSFSNRYHRDFRTVPAVGGNFVDLYKFEDWIPIFDALESLQDLDDSVRNLGQRKVLPRTHTRAPSKSQVAPRWRTQALPPLWSIYAGVFSK